MCSCQPSAGQRAGPAGGSGRHTAPAARRRTGSARAECYGSTARSSPVRRLRGPPPPTVAVVDASRRGRPGSCSAGLVLASCLLRPIRRAAGPQLGVDADRVMTRPRLRGRPALPVQLAGTTVTGHGACAATCWLTEPSSSPAARDRPRQLHDQLAGTGGGRAQHRPGQPLCSSPCTVSPCTVQLPSPPTALPNTALRQKVSLRRAAASCRGRSRTVHPSDVAVAGMDRNRPRLPVTAFVAADPARPRRHRRLGADSRPVAPAHPTGPIRATPPAATAASRRPRRIRRTWSRSPTGCGTRPPPSSPSCGRGAASTTPPTTGSPAPRCGGAALAGPATFLQRDFDVDGTAALTDPSSRAKLLPGGQPEDPDIVVLYSR